MSAYTQVAFNTAYRAAHVVVSVSSALAAAKGLLLTAQLVGHVAKNLVKLIDKQNYLAQPTKWTHSAQGFLRKWNLIEPATSVDSGQNGNKAVAKKVDWKVLAWRASAWTAAGIVGTSLAVYAFKKAPFPIADRYLAVLGPVRFNTTEYHPLIQRFAK